MALISCPECHKEVSDKAAVCPHCGVRISPAGSPLVEHKKWLAREYKEGRHFNKPIGCTLTLAIYIVIVVIAAIGITTNHFAYNNTSSFTVSGNHSDFEIVKDSVRFERRTNNSTVYIKGKITNYREQRCYIEFEYAICDSGGNVIFQSTAISQKSIEPGKNFSFLIEYYDESVQASSFEILRIIGH